MMYFIYLRNLDIILLNLTALKWIRPNLLRKYWTEVVEKMVHQENGLFRQS